jgi:hypothetical protein
MILNTPRGPASNRKLRSFYKKHPLVYASTKTLVRLAALHCEPYPSSFIFIIIHHPSSAALAQRSIDS